MIVMRLSGSVWVLLLLFVILLGASAPLAEPLQPQARGVTPQEQTAQEAGKLPGEIRLEDGTKVARGTPKPGDICIFCNHAIDEHDAVFSVRGHRLPVHLREMEARVGEQLTRFVARLEPRSALFRVSERTSARSAFWLLAGSYVLLALIFAALSSQRALMKGYSPSRWLALGLLFHVFAYGVLLALPGRRIQAPAGLPKGLKKIAATYQPVACPKCGEGNHPSATKCTGCGGTLVARIGSEVGRAGLREE